MMISELAAAPAASPAEASVSSDAADKSQRLHRSATDQRTRHSSLVANIFWLYGLQGLTYVTPLLLVPYLMRALGADRYGAVVLAQSLAQYFTIATDYGFNYSATRSIASTRGDQRAVSRIFCTVAVIKLSLLLIGAAVMFAVVNTVSRFHSDVLIYEAGYLAVVGNAIFPQWLFQGMENMRMISMITGATKLGAALSVLVLVHHRQDALLAIVLLSAGQLASGVVGACVGIRRYIHSFSIPNRSEIAAAIQDGKHLFLTTASISLFTNTNTVLVGLIAGNAQAGYFGIADKLARATAGLIFPVIQAAYPHTIRLASESKRAVLQFLRTTMSYGALFAAAAGVAIVLLARPIGHAAFGRDVSSVLTLIRCSAAFPLLATVSAILGTLALIPFGCDRAQSKLLLSAGILNLALASFLISLLGALGGVLSMTTTETAIIMGNIFVLSRKGIQILPWRS